MLQSAQTRQGRHTTIARNLSFLVPLAIALYPLLRVIDPNCFYVEETIHKAYMAYFADAERHLSLPMTLNFGNAVGSFVPVFYGFLLYPLSGLLSIFVSRDAALPLMLISVTIYQSYLLQSVLFRLIECKWLSYIWTAIFIWSSYSLVNIYARSDLPEYIGTVSVSISALYIFLTITADDRTALRHLGLAVLWYVFSVGTHPISAVYGLFIIVIEVFLLSVVSNKEFINKVGNIQFVTKSIAVIALGIFCVFPWIFIVSHFSEALNISDRQSFTYFPGRIDSFINRIWPIPYDSLVGEEAFSDIRTPFLYGQINVPLLILSVLISIEAFRQSDGRVRRTLITMVSCSCFMIASGFLALSLPTGFDVKLPKFMVMAQFGYRLITYVNALFLLNVVLISFISAGRVVWPSRYLVMASSILATLAAVAVFINMANPHGGREVIGVADLKLSVQPSAADQLTGLADASAIKAWRSAILSFRTLPPQGITDYSTGKMYSELGAEHIARLSLPVRNGEVGSTKHECGKDESVLTNVIAFPWSKLIVNGRPIPTLKKEYFLGFLCQDQNVTIEYRNATPVWFRTWLALARIVFLGWVFFAIWSGAVSTARYRGSRDVAYGEWSYGEAADGSH